jgi:hypothetical protein
VRCISNIKQKTTAIGERLRGGCMGRGKVTLLEVLIYEAAPNLSTKQITELAKKIELQLDKDKRCKGCANLNKGRHDICEICARSYADKYEEAK